MKLNEYSLKVVIFRFIGLLFVLVACPLFGQVLTKKPLNEEDYSLWSTLQTDGLSDMGGWTSYRLRYESGLDTLIVKSTDGRQAYAFAKGFNSNFKEERFFMCMLPGNQLHVLELSTGKNQVCEYVISYQLSKVSDCIILHCKNSSSSWLEIRTLDGNLMKKIEDVIECVISPSGNKLLYFSTGLVTVLELSTFTTKTIAKEDNCNYSNGVWDKHGVSFAYIRSATDITSNVLRSTVCFYRFKGSKLFIFDSKLYENFSTDMKVSTEGMVSLLISDDGQRVIFGLKSVLESKKNVGAVQQWNAKDVVLYPVNRKIDGWNRVEKAAVWHPIKNKFFQITTNKYPKFVLNGNQRYALIFNPYQNKTLGNTDELSDYYLYDLETGTSKMLLQQQTNSLHSLLMSPGGKFILYFRNNDWFVYTIATDSHQNLTKSLQVSFIKSESKYFEKSPVGIAGWTANDASVLLYDDYDIWMITTGKQVKKLTSGRSKKIRYRVVFNHDEKGIISQFNGFISPVLSIEKGLLLRVTCDDDYASGYSILDKKYRIQNLTYGLNLADRIIKAKKASCFLYRVQNFTIPPRLEVKKSLLSTSKVLVESNLHQNKYLWSKSELVHFSNSRGISLKAALFYPSGYDSSKKYPMIVSIYQLQSSLVNVYVNPTLRNSTGFNVTDLVSKGYFVLLPDIVYEQGKTGLSAVDCVLSATKSVLDKGIVDANKIGLIGHSFGGYETNFIITQSSLFATAISGAGVSDLTSGYFSVSWNSGTPDYWRYEAQQMRIGKPYYDEQNSYLVNSPLWYANKIETPLLSWTGEEDRQVHYYQSIAFHLALRRLDKPNILLVYPKEKHVLEGIENQKDLTRKLHDWFAYFLKKEEPSEWISKGFL